MKGGSDAAQPGNAMRIHIGCEMTFDFQQATPLIAMLNVHYSRASDLDRPDFLVSNPPVPIESYRDSFGNGAIASPRRPAALPSARIL